MSKMTCIIFARHQYRKGDVQQQRVTYVHVDFPYVVENVDPALGKRGSRHLRTGAATAIDPGVVPAVDLGASPAGDLDLECEGREQGRERRGAST